MNVMERLKGEAETSEGQFTIGGKPWRAFDIMAVELETAELLYGLVKANKPKLVYESGSGKGYATMAIGHALNENGFGELVSFEPEPLFREVAQSKCEGLPVNFIGVPLNTDAHPDFVFLDSGPGFRQQEMNRYLAESTFLVVHDAYRYKELQGGFMIRVPRGLWMRDQRATLWRSQEARPMPKIAIETGILHGNTTKKLAAEYEEVHAIELSQELYDAAVEKFKDTPNVHLYHGDSKEHLPRLCKEIQAPIYFYLDAHFCYDDPCTARNSFPLWDELDAIAKREWADVVYVDDLHTWGKDRPDLSAGMQDDPDAWQRVSAEAISERLKRVTRGENTQTFFLEGKE